MPVLTPTPAPRTPDFSTTTNSIKTTPTTPPRPTTLKVTPKLRLAPARSSPTWLTRRPMRKCRRCSASVLLMRARPRYVHVALLDTRCHPIAYRIKLHIHWKFIVVFIYEHVTDCHHLQGPLVGQRQPSSAITQEYATADATYQAKTAVCEHLDILFSPFLPLTIHDRRSRKSTHTTAR